MKKAFLCLALSLLLLAAVVPVGAANAAARDLTNEVSVTVSDGNSYSALLDSNYYTYQSLPKDCTLTLSSQTPVAGLYLLFDRTPKKWVLSDSESEYVCGENGFLHEYVDVSSLCGSPKEELTLAFPSGAVLSDVYVFSEGTLPDYVQVWEGSDKPCDLLLFSTHSDDDQLFFAGLLPTYTARGYSVQVTYFVHHWDTHDRPHELLNGLWNTGVTRYPIISEFPDAYSESIAGAEQNLAASGFDREEVVAWQTELLRSLRPQVVVGHDVEGEYGHGQHRYNTDTLIEALSLAGDSSYVLEDNASLEVWDTPRCYLHMYSENAVVCDFDQPLDAFDGLTAFEVSKAAFEFHISQQWTWFADWIDVEKASDITTHSPCRYGLFYASQGYENDSTDFFFGIDSYAVQAELDRIEQEIVDKLETEKEEKEEELEEAEEALEDLSGELEETRGKISFLYVLLIWILGILVIVFVSFVLLSVILRKRRAKRRRIARRNK